MAKNKNIRKNKGNENPKIRNIRDKYQKTKIIIKSKADKYYALPKTNHHVRSAKSPPAMELAVEEEADE